MASLLYPMGYRKIIDRKIITHATHYMAGIEMACD